MPEFKLVSDYKPTGDQPKAIRELVDGLRKGYKYQTLLGVTGSGKTFTMANIIAEVQRPTLVIAHNKTLAAQLCAEFKQFFPYNAVEYFVSYYDYYQPEAYIPELDLYIEKDSSINDEIDRLRHSATQAVMSRRDVIVVASVSCIYGLGTPEDYKRITLAIKKGEEMDREEMLLRLVEMQYERNDFALQRGKFRVRGDSVEIFPIDEEVVYRIEFFGDEVERILEIDPITGELRNDLDYLYLFPATHYVAPWDKIERAIASIEEELKERLAYFEKQGKFLEAQRLKARTLHDLELIREIGYCPGIENYSRHFDGRLPGQPPYTLIDYFPEDFLLFIDESHQTIPQLRSMYEGDKSRKDALVEYGWRLPSAYDNRPLKFEEFEKKINQVIFVSATPGPYELAHSQKVVEQIIRPTGLVDPEVEVRPTKGQIDDLIGEIKKRVERGERALVTTLTIKMAEDLSEYLSELGIKVHYLHSEVETLDRVGILRDLRLGVYDVVVGVNLLREGLDLPEVSLVAILDADKEGFLRSETSLIQMIGRASRNINGKVIMYADTITESMRKAIDETNRRRKIQMEYNEKHGITPETIKKAVHDILQQKMIQLEKEQLKVSEEAASYLDVDYILSRIVELEREMKKAAANLEFERAAQLRDEIKRLKELVSAPSGGKRS